MLVLVCYCIQNSAYQKHVFSEIVFVGFYREKMSPRKCTLINTLTKYFENIANETIGQEGSIYMAGSRLLLYPT